MNNVIHYILYAVVLMLLACTGGKPASERDESREAKRLMQGVWIDDDSENAVFQMRGDSVYYSDSTSMPAYFRVVDDTLFIGAEGRYHIEKQTEHLLWIKSQTGELTKLRKSDDEQLSEEFEQSKPKILTLTEVQKRDTVVFHNGQRYHLYIAINPTRYKVSRQVVNEDGISVENVYYDNIIHLSIFQGERQLFSRDFRKSLYEKRVPAQILSQAILNNMEYEKVDDAGFHVRTSVCVPDDASCYMVGHTVSFNGQLTTQMLEY